ncbi:MAG TPA: glycosyltransferase family 1 protein [Actinomycetales bacterium]|nr:glycosyltransferase family 1 protein [Actinomycetales bacterium]
MKVLVAAESFLPSMNGVTTTVLRTLDHLAERGHEALVICPGPAPRQYAGFPVIEVTSFPWMGMRVGFPTRILTTALRMFQPDVVHAAAPFSLGFHALVAADRRGIPTCAVYQTDLAGFSKRNHLSFLSTPSTKWLGWAHQHADVNLAPSTPAAADLTAWGINDVIVWPHGVDATLFDPARRYSEAGHAFRAQFQRTGRPVVGYIGRLNPEKEVERLGAVAELADLVVVGDGTVRQRLEGQLPTALFTGRLGGEDLAAAYASLDVFVHTGRHETFGLTVQEAMAAGVPVVAPNEGGPVDQVVDGETGFLFDPDRPEEMREAIRRLVSDPELRRSMGEAGRRRALTRSWEAINDDLIGYWHLAAERRYAREYQIA